MRLSNDVVAARQKFIEDFFKTNPNATEAMASTAIKQATGIAMSPGTISQIRTVILGSAPIVKSTVPVEAPVKDSGTAGQLKEKIKAQEEEIRQLKHELMVLSKARISQRGSITIIDVPAGTPDAVARAVGKVLTDG